jgi:hypothetical protein
LRGAVSDSKKPQVHLRDLSTAFRRLEHQNGNPGMTGSMGSNGCNWSDGGTCTCAVRRKFSSAVSFLGFHKHFEEVRRNPVMRRRSRVSLHIRLFDGLTSLPETTTPSQKADFFLLDASCRPADHFVLPKPSRIR